MVRRDTKEKEEDIKIEENPNPSGSCDSNALSKIQRAVPAPECDRGSQGALESDLGFSGLYLDGVGNGRVRPLQNRKTVEPQYFPFDEREASFDTRLGDKELYRYLSRIEADCRTCKKLLQERIRSW